MIDVWELIKDGLPPGAHHLLLYLKYKGGNFKTSISELSQATGYNEKTTRSHLRSLYYRSLVQYSGKKGKKRFEIQLNAGLMMASDPTDQTPAPPATVEKNSQAAPKKENSQPLYTPANRPPKKQRTVGLSHYKDMTWVKFWGALRENISARGREKFEKILAFQQEYEPRDLSPQIIRDLSERSIKAPVSFFASRIHNLPGGGIRVEADLLANGATVDHNQPQTTPAPRRPTIQNDEPTNNHNPAHMSQMFEQVRGSFTHEKRCKPETKPETRTRTNGIPENPAPQY